MYPRANRLLKNFQAHLLRLACAPKGPLADALTDVTSELVNLGVCCLYSVLNTGKRVKWVLV